MSNHWKATHGRTLGRRRAEELISGRMPSLAPSPRSIGYTRPRFQRTIDSPLLPRPNMSYNMPGRFDGQDDDEQRSDRQQHQQTDLPSVIVIDESDDEVEFNRQLRFAEGVRRSAEDQDDLQDQQNQPKESSEQNGQDDDTEEAQQCGQDENIQSKHESSPAYESSNDEESQHILAGQRQRLRDAQEQTRALLDLPEVDISEHERIETPRAMVCELLAHQRVGLTWLIRQEEDPNKRGSILADGMGLGKTIEALGLIVSRRSDPVDPFCKTTLIVAPLGLLPQWQDEIQRQITLRNGRKLSTFTFHGSSTKNMTIWGLLQHDIVLCTYGKLVSEYNMYTKGIRHKCKLLSREAKFYRVILDEAHFIKNKNTQSSKAVCQLQAVHRLCMTGTPLMNNVTELYPLIRFLGIKPYSVWENFSEHIDRPIRKWSSGMETPAMLRLQTLLKSLVLRRNKDSHLDGKRIINLKERVEIEVYVEFGEEQQAFYNALQLRQKLKFNKFLKAGIVMKNYMQILTWLLRQRQACDHPYLVQNHCIPDICRLDAEGMINLALQLPLHVQDSLKAIRRFKCPRCVDLDKRMTKNPVIISPCGHCICAECYSILMEEGISQYGGIASMHGKLKCPSEGCPSIITPYNILMHNFFVDALKGAEVDIKFSDDDEDPYDYGLSDDQYDITESESEGEVEVEEVSHATQNNQQVEYTGEQREASLGLFVDQNPSEPDPYSRDKDLGEELFVPDDEKLQKTENLTKIRQSRTPQVARPSARQSSQMISRASPGKLSRSQEMEIAPMIPPVCRTLQNGPAKGECGNPVNLDDEEEEAAFYALSKQMASLGSHEHSQHVKTEYAEAKDSEDPAIPSYDGPSSPNPRIKRKARGSDRPNSESKRARTRPPLSSMSGLRSHRSSHQNYVGFNDEEGAFASPSAYHVNTGDFNPGQGRRAESSFSSRVNPIDLDDDQQLHARYPARYPKVEEDEEIEPDIHRLGQRARDVLQRPFVSLSNKRQIADQSKRAMAAYQKRVENEWVASAKTEKIMELLKLIRRDHRGEKTLIFSLWTVFLDMLEPPLRKAGFKYTFYTGGMKTDNRTAAVQTFMTSPELDVMLISLSAGSCGLNLTAANHVILTEPFWNPYIEEQAIDRTHRLGQEKKVFVYRILIKNTIEEYIVRLQKQKKDLVSAALCDAQTDSPLKKLTIGELRQLFGV